MLSNIKSTYFVDIIFSFVDEEQKLKIVKCNKSLQQNINISIINYKLFKGKYIKYASNGIGIEYLGFNNQIVFKGEYLNGKRNGKGKEGDNFGEIIFEGEYLNGKRNGKGKEYFDRKLYFEGEYLNGKRNGKGKEYYSNGKLKFDGEYLNDLRTIGTFYDGHGNAIYKINNTNGLGKE